MLYLKCEITKYTRHNTSHAFVVAISCLINIRAETCREYKGHIIKYFVNCWEKEGIIIYSLMFDLCL
jgi:hypothetical protein